MIKTPTKTLSGIQYPRRSDRKATSFPIWLRNEDFGPIWEEETETEAVSRFGAGLRCRHLVAPESTVVIVCRESGRRAKARVRYSRFNPDGKRELGIEFIDIDNFWNLDWNSSEPMGSDPEEIRTPSGLDQIREAIFPAEVAEERVQQSKSSPLSSGRRKNGRLDRELVQEEAFVFTEDGKPLGAPVRTLAEFVSSLTNFSPSVVEGHTRRGDFSQWIASVFHDQFLASEMQKLEQQHRPGDVRDLSDSMARLIAEYRNFSDES